MSARSEEISIHKKKYTQIILLNYGMPHEKFLVDERAQKNRDQGISTHILEISPDTNTLVWPKSLPKMDEKTKIIVSAHGMPASDIIMSDARERMSVTELAKIIVENTKPGTIKLRVSVEICSGGSGKSRESHDDSFAVHLARELCALGIEDSVISAALGLMYITAQGRAQVAPLDFERRQSWLALNEGVFWGGNKETYLSLFEFSPSRGKSPGSKVMLIFNKARGFIPTYPYGLHQNDDSEAAIQTRENYRNAQNAYKAIKNKAMKALNSVLLEIEQLPAYKELFENEFFRDCLRKLKEDLEQYEMYDSKTIANCVMETMQHFRKTVPKESAGVKYHLLSFRFNSEIKKKIEQIPQLKFYLDLQIKLSDKCREAICKIEDHIFNIDKKRQRELITMAASTASYDRNFIAECHQAILKEAEGETILKTLEVLAHSNGVEQQMLLRSSSQTSYQSANRFAFLQHFPDKLTQTPLYNTTSLSL